MKKTYIHIISAIVFLASCTSEDDLIQEQLDANPLSQPPAGSAGSLNLSNYVAIGNSVTAGFTAGALHPVGQANSYPVLLAKQFAIAGGGDFVYPQISSGFGYGGVNADGSIRGRSYIDIASASTDPAKAIQINTGSELMSSTDSKINNFGVPGIRVVDVIIEGYGTRNSYFGSFQSGPTASVLLDAINADPTFFSVWLGSNDVLGYAVSGGKAGENFNLMDRNTFTEPDAFKNAINTILDSLSADGANGVLLNIPPITVLPFFRAVTQLSPTGFKLIPLNAPMAAIVNQGYAQYNAGLQVALAAGIIQKEEADRRKIEFVSGNNPPVITDESLTAISAGTLSLPQYRHATEQDLYPLTALAIIGSRADPNNPASVIGVGVPIPDSLTLTFNEQLNVITRTAQFNGILTAEATKRANITLVDVGPLFADFFGLSEAEATALALSKEAIAAADEELGREIGGFTVVPLELDPSKPELLFNSIFSSDGIHPNPRGAAIVANEIISTLNATYNADIPLIDVLAQPSIFAVLPQ